MIRWNQLLSLLLEDEAMVDIFVGPIQLKFPEPTEVSYVDQKDENE